jgi:S1-C subfamily serine protease
MTRRLLAAALLCVALSACSISPVEQRHAEMINPTVKVETTSSTGSGTFISKRHVLTNWHVVANKAEVVIWGFVTEGTRELPLIYKGKVIARDEARDLAVVEIDREWAGPVAHMASPDARLLSGEDVWTAGAPLGKPVHTTHGYIRVVKDVSGYKGVEAISTTAFATWGNSGGGLYRFRNGRYELIGVVHALEIVGGQVVLSEYTYALPLASVREFLRGAGVIV